MQTENREKQVSNPSVHFPNFPVLLFTFKSSDHNFALNQFTWADSGIIYVHRGVMQSTIFNIGGGCIIVSNWEIVFAI